MEKVRSYAMFCAGPGCVDNGNLIVKAALDEELRKQGLNEEIKVGFTACDGICSDAPVMSVYPDEILYKIPTI
jgi:NADH:ubiquinone oxidoreductase subunit E